MTGMDDVPAVESTYAPCDPPILVVAETGLTSVVANADADADRRYGIGVELLLEGLESREQWGGVCVERFGEGPSGGFWCGRVNDRNFALLRSEA